ncbi:MAG: glycosyltransferase [Candidatus Daviesbacteria bacterium]|nr:glycosyltransferase [Candidatus Daviesbacteria bacterium]
MKKDMVGVSAVIPSFNCKNNLFRLLDTLKKSSYKNLEVIAVDNGSRDNTLSEGMKKYKWVKWVDAGGRNIGQTGCYNLGMAYIKKGNHFLYVDSDVTVEKEMVQNLVTKLNSDLKIGIVTPMILYLSDKNWVNQAGAYVDLTTGKVTVGWGSKKNFLEPKEVQNSGTVMLIRNEVVEKIGGFDNWFLCYFDPDYCLRAKKVGYEIWYEPSAVCYHDQSKNPAVWRPRVLSRAYLLGRNRTLFMRRHGKVFSTYVLFLPFLFGYYFVEAAKFGIFNKWLELVLGTLVGFVYPLKKGNYITLPKGENYPSFSVPKENLLQKITVKTPFSWSWLLRKLIGDPKTVLDIGCGDGALMRTLSKEKNWKIVGIDIFKDSVIKAKTLGVYDSIIQGDVIEVLKKMITQRNRFNTVFCSQLIEHLSKKEGNRLLDLMDQLALERIVVTTPRGFVEQREEFLGNNHHQHHKSGWMIEDFVSRGYKVYGLGLSAVWRYSKLGLSKARIPFISLVSYLMSPLVYFIPALGEGILAVKKIKK